MGWADLRAEIAEEFETLTPAMDDTFHRYVLYRQAAEAARAADPDRRRYKRDWMRARRAREREERGQTSTRRVAAELRAQLARDPRPSEIVAAEYGISASTVRLHRRLAGDTRRPGPRPGVTRPDARRFLLASRISSVSRSNHDDGGETQGSARSGKGGGANPSARRTRR